MTESNLKIYLKDSDKSRLADKRIRIIRESNPLEPCRNEDLVFEKADDESLIPADALFKWCIDMVPSKWWFYTTAERCKKMVSEDPSHWTFEKLQDFALVEKKLYENWRDGHVYGIVVEKWDEKQRKWTQIDSIWGMYGAKEVLQRLTDEIDLLYDEIDSANIPVCIDEEEMAWEFDNTEKKINEFK